MPKLRLLLIISINIFALETHIDPKIYHNQFGSYYLPKNHDDRPAIKRIKKGIVHELDTLRYIKQIYPKGTAIIHAGTYFGDMLPFFSKLVGDKTVWAFEPVKENYQCALANIQLNKLSNIKIQNMGLSEKSNKLPMITKIGSVPAGGSSRIATSKILKAQTIETVFVDSIDHILENNTETISIIHLDIEGHEKQALAGAVATIAKYRPILVLEVFSKEKPSMDKYLAKMGYRFKKRVNHNCVYFPEEKAVID